LNQSYASLEVIVVDDCSTDETAELLRSYRDPRLRTIRHDQNRQLPAALNSGFALAQGQYLTWTSDDNRYAPTAIATMAQLLETTHVDLVYADMRYMDRAGNLGERAVLQEPFDPVSGHTIGACFLYTRWLRDLCGDYDEECFLAEDFDYWIRVSQQGVMRHLPEVLYYYRRHERSLTENHAYTCRIVATTVLVQAKHHVLTTQAAAAAALRFLGAAHGKPPVAVRAASRLLRVLTFGRISPYETWHAVCYAEQRREIATVIAAYLQSALEMREAVMQITAILATIGDIYWW